MKGQFKLKIMIFFPDPWGFCGKRWNEKLGFGNKLEEVVDLMES